MLKAVIFDVDGTLVDSLDLHAKGWQDALLSSDMPPYQW
jgi:beta-phosphoglucomutase-like phosphatase (HAD superfamily)